MDSNATIGRFAPSPTGRMHLGNVYAALLSWLSAKSQGGKWLLRIEDLDEGRSRQEYADLLMEDLRWFGLDWDLGPFYQSKRGDIYAEQLSRLEQTGLLYPCYLSRGEIMATQAPHESDGRIVYGPELRAKNEILRRTADPKRTPSQRLRTSSVDLSISDGHYGSFSINLERQCGDFLIKRSDGAWAYQFAVVVDDALMGVTEVVRGRDLLLSVPQQLYLYRLLQFREPRFAHIPLLCNPQGQRLCKRDKALDMGELRKQYSPEQLIGRLAFLTGLTTSPEAISPQQLLPLFAWEKIPTEDIYVTGDF